MKAPSVPLLPSLPSLPSLLLLLLLLLLAACGRATEQQPIRPTASLPDSFRVQVRPVERVQVETNEGPLGCLVGEVTPDPSYPADLCTADLTMTARMGPAVATGVWSSSDANVATLSEATVDRAALRKALRGDLGVAVVVGLVWMGHASGSSALANDRLEFTQPSVDGD